MDLEIEKIRDKYRESDGSGGFVNPANLNHYTDWLEQQLKNCNLQIVNRRYSPEEGKVRGGSTIKWETFTDESYHNMVAVRPVGDTDFNSPRLFHFIFPENAEKFKLLAEMAFVAKPNGG